MDYSESYHRKPESRDALREVIREFRRRKIDPGRAMTAYKLEPVVVGGRAAVSFDTPSGVKRVRFVDGKEPKCIWQGKGGKAHWHGLEQAVEVLESGRADSLYIVNGEFSVWVCEQADVAAICTCAGEGAVPEQEELERLKHVVASTGCSLFIVYDIDDAGRTGAERMVAGLADAGIDSQALSLPDDLGDGGDVDDLHQRVGDDELAEALANLPVLPIRRRDDGHVSEARHTSPARNHQSATDDEFAVKQLERFSGELARTEKGGRHKALIKIAYTIGGYVGANRLSESTAISALMSACRADGLAAEEGETRVEKTVRECLSRGALKPFPLKDVEVSGENANRRDAKEKEPTQAEMLVSIGSGADLFRDAEGEPYARFSVNGHREVWPIRQNNRGFRHWLIHQFFQRKRKPPTSDAIQSALRVLEARTMFESRMCSVARRIADADGAVVLDLCNSEWEAVVVDSEGWRVVSESPVPFVRSRSMLELPRPERGGCLSELRRFINAPNEEAWVLVISWLVGAYHPSGPYPILVINGEHGSAKSTTVRVIRELLDPSRAPLRSVPKDEHDLAIAASNAWVVALDNLSGIPNWLSDAMCRLSTGGGFGTRALYTDRDEAIFDSTRPIVVNGIDDLGSRDDLVSRALVVSLPRIQPEERRTEADLRAEFETMRPLLLGALLDVVSEAIRRHPAVKLDSLPRMADFARWITAAEPALGWEPGTFVRVYSESRLSSVEDAIETDQVASTIRQFMTGASIWEGTATVLLEQLEQLAGEKAARSRTWPKSAAAVSSRLRRCAPLLRHAGIDVERSRNGSERRITMKRIEKTPSSSSLPSQQVTLPGIHDDGGGFCDAAGDLTNPSGDGGRDDDDDDDDDPIW